MKQEEVNGLQKCIYKNNKYSCTENYALLKQLSCWTINLLEISNCCLSVFRHCEMFIHEL